MPILALVLQKQGKNLIAIYLLPLVHTARLNYIFDVSFAVFFFSVPRSSYQRCSIKKVFLKISQNSQEKTCDRVFFNKIAGLRTPVLQNTSK